MLSMMEGGFSMSQTAYARYLWVTEQTGIDPEYRELERQRVDAEPQVKAFLDTLSQDQRDMLMDYFGILQEMELRVLEFAYFAP